MERLLTAQEVAQLISASDKTVYMLAARGEIPCIRITSKMVRFDPGEIREWIKAKSQSLMES